MQVTTAMFEYLNVKPTDDYLSFNKHAESKFVTSASRGQTNKALYTSAQNRWLNYKDYFEPYQSKINPVMQELGYSF